LNDSEVDEQKFVGNWCTINVNEIDMKAFDENMLFLEHWKF